MRREVIKICVLVVIYLSSVQCNCVSNHPPDGTDVALYFTECNISNSHTLKVLSATVVNADGSSGYPINFVTPIKLQGTAMNIGPEIDALNASMTVYIWTKHLTGCRWHTLPTLGLLDNLNMCNLFNCPWPANNRFSAEATIDLTKYSSLISRLFGKGIYRADILLKSSPSTEIGCVRFEAKLA